MIVIGSHNGLKATEEAWRRLKVGAAPLDALVEGVTLVEDDPDELSVGYGGLPNEEGVVELDAAVMDGKSHRGAGVAGLKNVRHPTKVARLLMEQTRRSLLVGEGALAFARANGFHEENLLTEKARSMWLHWKRIRSKIDDWVAPTESEVSREILAWFDERYRPAARQPKLGTVHCAAQDASGNLAVATSTSGHAFKMQGRVGDSPILGAGLYVDNEIGTCGSIGYGEANLENLSSFAVVELMRNGKSPVDAGLEALRRIAKNCHGFSRDEHGQPTFNHWLFILARDGRHAGVTMHGPKEYAIADESGARLAPCVALFE